MIPDGGSQETPPSHSENTWVTIRKPSACSPEALMIALKKRAPRPTEDSNVERTKMTPCAPIIRILQSRNSFSFLQNFRWWYTEKWLPVLQTVEGGNLENAT
jgi:hypothetical protein